MMVNVMEEKIEFRQLSSAEHFRRNKQLAGLDNPAKAGYTTIRELVENALDGVELIPDCRPDIKIYIDDLQMYHKIVVIDNGYGVPNKEIPNAFACIFYGAKYEVRQQRGTLGAGGKLVCMYGYVSTTKPYRVVSATQNSELVHVYDLGIDLNKNEPIIYNYTTRENLEKWHGTAIRLYTKINLEQINKIKRYLQLTTIAMPYVSIKLVVNKQTMFEHVGNKNVPIPKRAEKVKLHPHGVDTHDIQKMIEEEIKKHGDNGNHNLSLQRFLSRKFQRVGIGTATKFLKFAGLSEDKKINDLNHVELMRFVDKLNEFNDFQPPTTECLSLLTEENINAGLKEMFKPDYITYVNRKGVYGGHGFVVEIAIAYGGKIKPPARDYGFRVFRFANKMPLLYDQRACVLYKSIMEADFKHYDIQPNAPMVAMVHICSTKVPYKTEGKEYISSDYAEINKTIQHAVQEALRKVKDHIGNIERIEEEKHRKNRFLLFIPNIAKNLSALTGYQQDNLEQMFKKALNIEGE
jgi:DNA topoisomerase-6 subunit B